MYRPASAASWTFDPRFPVSERCICVLCTPSFRGGLVVGVWLVSPLGVAMVGCGAACWRRWGGVWFVWFASLLEAISCEVGHFLLSVSGCNSVLNVFLGAYT